MAVADAAVFAQEGQEFAVAEGLGEGAIAHPPFVPVAHMADADQNHDNDDHGQLDSGKFDFTVFVGGLRALKALGISPGVLHLNEGHSAFAVLEAIRMRMEDEYWD